MNDAPSDSFPGGNARGDGTARGTAGTTHSPDSGHSSDSTRSADSGQPSGSGGPVASGEAGVPGTSAPEASPGAGGAAGAGRGGSGGGRGDGPGDPGAGGPDPDGHDGPDDGDGRDGNDDAAGRDDRDSRGDHSDRDDHDAPQDGPQGPRGEDPPGADEEALRRLLHEAVRDVEPGDGTLERLRLAVPARRARKRQALVGAAAAVVLLCVAVPAVIRVSHATGSNDDHTAVAGHGQAVHGGTGGGKDDGGSRPGGGQPSGSGHPKDDRGGHGHDGKDKGGSGSGTSPDPGNTLAVRSPDCVPGALGNVQASVGAPDSGGTVYGTFRVSNVSGSDCTVDSAGTIATMAQGAADAAKITVVDHTAGDPAAGLPAPAAQPSELSLAPGQSYEVKFAWVPSASCPSGGGGEPSPDPSSSDSPTADGGDTGTGTTTQLYREDGPAGDGSVAVSHTAEPGGPTAAATIPNACEGTVYRTGLLPGS
ncbi:hypothetical protein [Streptomyces sp. TS71-3]|uniref:hypothetical protein n=1 Tax=Streptomyces sp. TS71-3 TaxID=2733862 RepID=UPI001B028B9E|nr:hypothetical protein [Streptomyces sp. TS71-3]GHJ39996.1 hypothetical protein Sm713_56050 [Streptomyces sp. TS71-3]